MYFATCEPIRALQFINHYHPKITKEKIPKLMRLIEEDKLRVLDPTMHDQCEIVLGSKNTESESESIDVQEAVLEISGVIASLAEDK